MKPHFKVEFVCPWCGLVYETGQELNEHAKEHYHESCENCILA